jgi:hypothetical protein
MEVADRAVRGIAMLAFGRGDFDIDSGGKSVDSRRGGIEAIPKAFVIHH